MTRIRRDGKVEFRFYRPMANDVRVVGLNGWSYEGLSMRQTGKGWWIALADLEPGEYRFKYLSDGESFTDFAAFGIEHGPRGLNSVLIVPEHGAVMMPVSTIQLAA